jgi:hypothetical protein
VADYPEGGSVQDDVDALPPQVSLFVERGSRLTGARTRDGRNKLEHASLRRRALGREVQSGPFVEGEPAKTEDTNRDAGGEVAASPGARHLHASETGPADLSDEDAAVERVETRASPPPSQSGQRNGQSPRPPGAEKERQEPQPGGGEDDARARRPDG